MVRPEKLWTHLFQNFLEYLMVEETHRTTFGEGIFQPLEIRKFYVSETFGFVISVSYNFDGLGLKCEEFIGFINCVQ